MKETTFYYGPELYRIEHIFTNEKKSGYLITTTEADATTIKKAVDSYIEKAFGKKCYNIENCHTENDSTSSYYRFLYDEEFHEWILLLFSPMVL